MPVISDYEKKMPRVLSVGELNRTARELIERSLPLVWVGGEISNLTRAASGHCYFSLKDSHAQVRCVIFRSKLQLHDWKPENGMQVEVRACPSFYEQRGEFQLNVEVIRRAGSGALYEAFERLKAKLQGEGLFDAAGKRPLPAFPRAIGVVTSLHAAALRDVLTTLKRRMPAMSVIIYPAAVQGASAAQQIAAAIGVAGARAECDVLIVCRGGGSIEDLWAFNEEVVARALFACQLPVVCGIGHETDFTIADFVADARAPTPTAAAQMASPSRDDLWQELAHRYQRLLRLGERALERRMQQVDLLARRLILPGERIERQLGELGHLARRMCAAWAHGFADSQWRLRALSRELVTLRPDLAALASHQQALAQRMRNTSSHRLETAGARLASLASQLTQLNPQAVLARGYSMVETADGSIVRNSDQIERDDKLKITFARGWARTHVDGKG
jgi:exodeoxyribonuclease VII large subunit